MPLVARQRPPEDESPRYAGYKPLVGLRAVIDGPHSELLLRADARCIPLNVMVSLEL